MSAWQPYRPSNGTEGMGFIEVWCGGCARDAGHNCSILARSLAFDLSDPRYPKEWEINVQAREVRCTAFVPVAELSARAKRAWATRRRKRDEAHAGDLFGA